jgi:outer membrane protein OmpA-like peptidoglycan-associated protein
MIKAAQTTRTEKKPKPSTAGNAGQSKASIGAGNRHRANAFQLQTKLRIGTPNDAYEQEADRVAGEVMRTGDQKSSTSLGPGTAATQSIQRQCACGGSCGKCKKKQMSLKRREGSSHATGDAPSSVQEVLSSPGRPLDSQTRAFMEPRFGYDFGSVRIHTDSTANRSTSEVNALAFTVGNHIAFADGQYAAGTSRGNRLLAHELAHVVQQGGATADSVRDVHDGPTMAMSEVSDVVQRAGDPAAIPLGFACPPDFTTGRLTGADLLFPTGGSTVNAIHRAQLAAFIRAWVATGGRDTITVHGYASEIGDQGPNWTLSCERAQNVRDAMLALGVPSVHLRIAAHGESTDFGAAGGPNQHAVVSASPGGVFATPVVSGRFTPDDDFAGRSHSRFGVDELINLSFTSLPSRPAADFGGLRWSIVSGGGTLFLPNVDGTAIYRAPDRAATVRFELRVASGPTAGRVVASPIITIIEPDSVRMRAVAGTSPGFMPGGTIPVGRWGAGFLADVFVGPNDVSFLGVTFGEGVIAAVVTPPGSFLSPVHGRLHGQNTFGDAGPGNISTGTPMASQDQVSIRSTGTQLIPTGTVAGLPTCGIASDLNFAIPWEFSVSGGASGGARQAFAVANSHRTSNFFCHATTEKGGAGPFCRRIDGTTC